MKHISLSILCLFFLKIAVAQTNPTPGPQTAKQEDNLQKQDKDLASILSQKEMLNEQIRAYHEQAIYADTHVRPDNSNTKAASRGTVDADDDGMPDDWEALYGFNPSNPADAFGDYDLDGVMNLLEFQIGTSPNDADAPSVVNVSPADDLAILLSDASDQTLFRLQAGVYPLNYLVFKSSHPRIVIQGGWNASFTERDICQNLTELDGQLEDNILSINATGGENAIVLDGLTLRNGKGTFGSIVLRAINCKAYWSFVDCEIIANEPEGTFGGALYLIHRDTCQAEVTLVNTRITDNNTCGIYNQTVNAAQARWRLYNTSVSYNDDRDTLQSNIGLGIRGFTLSDARIDISMQNTILWGNDEFDLSFHGFGDSVVIRANRCDIGNTDFISYVLFDAAPDCINEDPQFVDAANGNLTLSASSPCLDAGLPVGLVFEGAGPDIGATPCLLSVSGLKETVLASQSLLVYPNPASDFIEIKSTENERLTATISLYNTHGRLLRLANFENNLLWDVQDLPTGVYWLQIQGIGSSWMGKFVKQ